MKQFAVIIEWSDGTVTEETVTEKAWFSFFYDALDSDDNVDHYTVETLKGE